MFSSERLFSLKENASDADIINQIPYPKLVACFGVGSITFSVSQTVNAVNGLWKYKVTKHDD